MNTAHASVPAGISRFKEISQAWLVVLLATCFGALLSGIDITLSPVIEANKLNESLNRVPALVPYQAGLDTTGPADPPLNIRRLFVDADGQGKKKTYPVFQAILADRTVGWVAKASGQGYADKVEVLIGLDPPADRITGLFILDQKETPGLGNKITDTQWRKQFVGKDTALTLTAVKQKASAPDEIDAITGATISSKAVCDIVNQSLSDLKKPLSDMADKNVMFSQ